MGKKMRLTIFTILTIVSLTKAPGQTLEKFEFSDCVRESMGDSTIIDRIIQTNDLTEINFTSYSNCIGNLEGQIKLTNDTLNLIYSIKGTEIVFCDCIFQFNYVIRGLKTLDKKKIKINGETVDKIYNRQFPKTDTSQYVFTIADIPPVFPGGHKKLMKYINKNLKHPKDSNNREQGGKVYVAFVINRDGSIDDNTVRVVKGINDSFDNEATRVIKKCPNWTPATIKGRPVKVKYVLPITFDLHKVNK